MKKISFLFLLLPFCIPVKAQLVYKDVAGIFYNRCTRCHHANGGAPFSMMSYSETYPWSLQIKANLNTGKMPPWPPDTLYTRFLHERLITQTEKNDIINWINSGTQPGDTTLAPPAPVYTSYHLNGTPDLILKIPAFASNANSSDAYNCFALPTGLTSDRYLRAFEIVPSNPSLVHHTVTNVDTTGTVNSDLSGGCFTEPGQYSIGGFAPGTPPTVFSGKAPLKIGIRIKAGSKIIMQQHYPAGSIGLIDSTEIRLYFYPIGTTGIRPVYVNTFLQNWAMSIPANTTKYYTAQYPTAGTLTVALSVYAVSPHGHHVNKNMLVYAYKTTPADTIPLIRIPNWDFNWQGMYDFKKLVKIPTGYKLYSKHLYDNTTNNPNNPNNPPQLVVSGTSTTDEMLFDSFQWLVYQTGDENIDIGGLLTGDTLLTASVNEPTSLQNITSYVYPNPISETGTLVITNERVANCELKVYDVFGKDVSSTAIYNTDSFIIRKEHLSPGIYFYSISNGKSSGSGKIVIMPTKNN